MNEILQRCPGCMQPLPGNIVCPACGTPFVFDQPAPLLPLRALLLQGRIGVGRAVEQNGDGITYLAFDEQTKKPVMLREFFPAAIAMRAPGQPTQLIMQGCEAAWRDCAQNFIELWRKLQRLRGLSALLAVTDVFEENGTAYAVYEYMECISLRDFLLRGKLGYISWERARVLLMPVLSTLAHLHQQGILHRGISPNTLLFCSDGKVRLSGFSIWQARTAHGDLTAELADGYAALEQYTIEDKQGPWTDIYAFAAVLYRSLIGSDPDSAVVRRQNDRLMVPAQFAERIPAYVINALINAMQVFPEDRTRTVEHLRAELSASPTAVAQSVAYAPPPARPDGTTKPVPKQGESDKKPPKERSAGAVALTTMGIIVGIGAVLCGVLAWVLYGDAIKAFFSNIGSEPDTTSVVTTMPSIVVPVLEGKTYSEELELEYENKLIFKVTFQADETAAEGQIMKQDVAAGTSVRMNATITLTVSSGPPLIELPDMVGRPIADARAELEKAGFVVVADEMTNDGTNEAGTVKSMNPLAGEYPKGKQVFLAVWGNADGSPLEGENATTTE